MTFPAYPECKDSGVTWLGGIPAHWDIKKFRYVFEESPEKITDCVVGDMLSVSGYRGIEVKQYNDEGRRRTDDELFGYRVVRPGQLVVNTMWLNYAGLGVSEHEGHVSPAYRSYWIDSEMDKRFIHHLMRSSTYVQGYTQLLTGIRPNSLQMGRDDLMVFPVLFPARVEQTQIARFLDHETARIDALIEDQQRLIELLKEKRQAVISHAVTKGLDPTVPMKDSGVEWLGEVPAHWIVRKGGYIGMLFGSEAVPEDMVNESGNLPFLKVGSLSADTLSIRQWDFFVDPSIEKAYRPRSQFVVFPKRGAAIFLNKVNVVEVSALLDPNLMGWEMEAGNDAYYFANVLKCRGLAELADVSTVPQINNKHISPEKFPVPPSGEQHDIVAFLDTEVSRFDQLVTEAENGVSLLIERRSALISAAVTGKIDVRGWQPPARAQSPELEDEAV